MSDKWDRIEKQVSDEIGRYLFRVMIIPFASIALISALISLIWG